MSADICNAVADVAPAEIIRVVSAGNIDEARAVMEDGSVAATKRFLSPCFYKARRFEPKTLKFRFDAMDLPERGRYRIQVVARNCFGEASAPIFSVVRESAPGKDKVTTS